MISGTQRIIIIIITYAEMYTIIHASVKIVFSKQDFNYNCKMMKSCYVSCTQSV